MYGYACTLPGAEPVAALPDLKVRLDGFARKRGYELKGVLVLENPGDRLEVWCDLMWSCQNFGVRDVVIPALSHLNECAPLAHFMCNDVARRIGGRVWTLGQSHPVAIAEDPAMPV